MKNTLTAQELKTKGTHIIKSKMKGGKEVVITVRGVKKYVVMTTGKYSYFKECELEAAFREVKKDVAQKKYKIKSIKQHIKDIKRV